MTKKKKQEVKKRMEMVFEDDAWIDREDPIPVKTIEHEIGLTPQLYMYDLQAVFRDAVQRVQQIYTGRLLGIAEPETTRERDRKLLAGDLEMTVAPGKVAVLLAQPQIRFAPTKVIIDDEASDWYDIRDVKVGKDSQLISPNPIPGCAFRASSPQNLSMDTAEISMFLTVELVNVSGKPQRFPRVMMVGHVVANRSEP